MKPARGRLDGGEIESVMYDRGTPLGSDAEYNDVAVLPYPQLYLSKRWSRLVILLSSNNSELMACATSPKICNVSVGCSALTPLYPIPIKKLPHLAVSPHYSLLLVYVQELSTGPVNRLTRLSQEEVMPLRLNLYTNIRE